MISAIVFDCGDTLLRLDPPREVIFRDAAAELGIVLEPALIGRAYRLVDFAYKLHSSRVSTEEGRSDFYREFNGALCSALGIERSADALHPRLLAAFRARRRWQPFPDAVATLRTFSERVPLFVLANWDARLPTLLAETGLEPYLSGAFASEILGAEKPARACFDAFVTRSGVDPATTIYVGNEYEADVVGARRAGLTPVLVDRDAVFPAADCLRVGSLAELVPLLSPRVAAT